jgi:Protein of unknown function (DUF3455)
MGLIQVAPPRGHVRAAVLEGAGFEIYEAVAGDQQVQGTLVWRAVDSSASLTMVAGADLEAPAKQVRVELSAGPAWKASDDSTAVGQLVRAFPAPEPHTVAWQLYRVTSSSGQGILSPLTYARRIFTHGGGPPSTPRRRTGLRKRVAWHAQYVLYQARPTAH